MTNSADVGAEATPVAEQARLEQAAPGHDAHASNPPVDADVVDPPDAEARAPPEGRARTTRACARSKRSREQVESLPGAVPVQLDLERRSGKTQRDYFRESIVARMKAVLSGDELERKVAEFTSYVTSLQAAPTQPGNDLTLWQLWQIAGQAEASDQALTMSELDAALDPASRAMALGILVSNLEAATRDAAADTSQAAIQRLERAVGACTEQLMPSSSGGAICAEASALVASSGLSDRLEVALASAAMAFSRRDELGTVERSGRAVLDWLRGCAAVDSLDSLEDVQAALTSAAAWRDSFERSRSTLDTAALKELSDAVVTAELRAEERALELTLSRSAAEGGGLLRTHIQAYRALLTRVVDAERNQRQLWHRCAAAEERLNDKERELAQAREQLRAFSSSRMQVARSQAADDLLLSSPSSYYNLGNPANDARRSSAMPPQPPQPSRPAAGPPPPPPAVRNAQADGRALLSGIKSTIEQQIIVSMASSADPSAIAHRVGCKITGVSVAAFAVAFPTATDGRVELCVTGERNLPSASAAGRAARADGGEPEMILVQLDGKVAVELLQGTVTMSGLITLHHEPPPSAFADTES